jgi:hypothetical protein
MEESKKASEADVAADGAQLLNATDLDDADDDNARDPRRGGDAPARDGDQAEPDAKGEATTDPKGAKKRRNIDAATDAIAKKFGKDAIRRGGAIG